MHRCFKCSCRVFFDCQMPFPSVLISDRLLAARLHRTAHRGLVGLIDRHGFCKVLGRYEGERGKTASSDGAI